MAVPTATNVLSGNTSAVVNGATLRHDDDTAMSGNAEVDAEREDAYFLANARARLSSVITEELDEMEE